MQNSRSVKLVLRERLRKSFSYAYYKPHLESTNKKFETIVRPNGEPFNVCLTLKEHTFARFLLMHTFVYEYRLTKYTITCYNIKTLGDMKYL